MRLLCALLLAIPALLVQAADRLVLLTATPGGSFSAFGEALKAAVEEADPTLEISLQGSRGSAENLPLLRAGKADLGMVEGALLHQSGPDALLLPVLSAMFPTPGMFVVRGDSVFTSVDDLRGRRVVFGAAGSGFVVLARYVLEGLGLNQETDFDAVLLKSARDGPPLILEGEASALWGGGMGWPAFEAVAQGPKGARFIGLGAGEVEKVRTRHPFLRAMTVPAGAYHGQVGPVTTVGSWSWLLARADLPDPLVYRFARALHKAQGALLRRFPAAEATASASVAALPPGAALHPAAERYYRESGLLP